MTDPEFRFTPRTGKDVWGAPVLPGYFESIQSAGTIAAPLLATVSFTLVALVLQAATPFTRWPDLALVFFVGAGLAQVFAVQSVIWIRLHMTTPDELRQWYPDDFESQGERPTEWLRRLQHGSSQNARKWARRTRAWINAGISLLLAGVAVSVIPPAHISPMRWVVITVAWVGVAVEASWVTGTLVNDHARPGLMVCSGAIITSGGATASAGFAATAGTASGAPATWWAVALAAVAVPFWLAALSGARLNGWRVRLYSPLRGRGLWVRAFLALLAPAILVLALWSAISQLVTDRRKALLTQHPGATKLLPKGVSIWAHHRARSRCAALPVISKGELAELLGKLGPASQPLREDLWERSPDSVVKVVDRGDAEIELGYYIVYPLLAETVSRIRSQQVADGGQLRPGDLAVSGDEAGWFISAVWAQNPKWMRRCVIATLVDALARTGAGSAGRPVFVGPATDRSRPLLQRYGFTAIGADDGIWSLEGDPP
jgi:hypothetical protein